MLKGLPSLLGPELLGILRAMGHGDEIAIVDGNYPADAHARRLVRMDGHGACAILDAILTILPLDEDVGAAFRPCPRDDCTVVEAIHTEFADVIARHDATVTLAPLQGSAFYDRVRACYAIVASSERRLFGNIILRKGVIPPE